MVLGTAPLLPEVRGRAVEVSVAAQEQTRGADSVGASRQRAKAVQNCEVAARCYLEDYPATMNSASGGHAVEIAVQALNQSVGVCAIQARMRPSACFAEFVYGLKRTARRKLIDGSESFVSSGSRRAIKKAVGRLDQTAKANGARAVRAIRELAKVIDCCQPSSGRQFEDGSSIVRSSACAGRAVEITVPRLDQIRSGQLPVGAGSGTESVQVVDDAAGRLQSEQRSIVAGTKRKSEEVPIRDRQKTQIRIGAGRARRSLAKREHVAERTARRCDENRTMLPDS
jgi:hypothetical protein